jgi:dCMP deaminase
MEDAVSNKWLRRFLDVAAHVAQWSKDPSTKVGAVAVDPATNRIIETGYNGLPRGVADQQERMERPAKYIWTAHAEENLVAHAARDRLEGATVYVTHMCCSPCTRMLINAGVKRICIGAGETSMPAEQFVAAREMLHEAGVELVRDWEIDT